MYRGFFNKILSATFALLTCAALSSSAQDIGLFSSPKGFGVSCRFSAKDGYDTVSLYLDTYGLWSERVDCPGVKCCYSHNSATRLVRYGDADLLFFAGPGASLGYVHDHDRRASSVVKLHRNPGVALALSCKTGCYFSFPERRIGVELSVAAEIGMHIRQDEVLKQKDLSWYKNGLYQALYPQITIYWAL